MKGPVFPAYALALVCFLAGASAQASPCYHPKRMVDGFTVDLQPLLDWWAAPKGTRPLSGWKHVRGVVVRDTPLGWVIAGKGEGSGQASTFFLKNPPRERLRRYQELQRQLPNYRRAEADTRQFLSRPLCTDWYSFWLRQWDAPPISLSEHREASALLGEINENINAITGELASLQDENGSFKVDAFALRRNEFYEGLPVFDHGSAQPFGDARSSYGSFPKDAARVSNSASISINARFTSIQCQLARMKRFFAWASRFNGSEPQGVAPGCQTRSV